jgi:hypothetical protein
LGYTGEDRGVKRAPDRWLIVPQLTEACMSIATPLRHTFKRLHSGGGILEWGWGCGDCWGGGWKYLSILRRRPGGRSLIPQEDLSLAYCFI